MEPTFAKFQEIEGKNDDPKKGTSAFQVQFNPASLKLSHTMELKDAGKNQQRQNVGKLSSSLSLELLFDTADVGTDVRLSTREILRFVQPQVDRKKKPQAAPRVRFQWGSFIFTGVMKTATEEIDFFRMDGVPLRAKLQVTMEEQDPKLRDPAADAKDAGLKPPPKSAAFEEETAQDLGRAADSKPPQTPKGNRPSGGAAGGNAPGRGGSGSGGSGGRGSGAGGGASGSGGSGTGGGSGSGGSGGGSGSGGSGSGGSGSGGSGGRGPGAPGGGGGGGIPLQVKPVPATLDRQAGLRGGSVVSGGVSGRFGGGIR